MTSPTPLMRAASAGDVDGVHAALNGPMDPQLWRVDSQGLGAFELAAFQDFRACAQAIEPLVDPMEIDGRKALALHAAILQGPLSAIEWLAPQVDPARQDRLGGARAPLGADHGKARQLASPAARAVLTGRVEALRALWSEGAAASQGLGQSLLWLALGRAIEAERLSSLEAAARASRDACVAWLVHAGAPFERRPDGRSLAMEAALGRPSLLPLFLNDPLLWEADDQGATIFHMLARAPKAIIESLIRQRPDLAGQADHAGFTPLISACATAPPADGSVAALEALLPFCDPLRKTFGGASAMALAIHALNRPAALWLAALDQGPALMKGESGFGPDSWPLEAALRRDLALGLALIDYAPAEACLHAIERAPWSGEEDIVALACQQRLAELEREALESATNESSERRGSARL